MKTRVLMIVCLCLTLLVSAAAANEFAIKLSVKSTNGDRGSTGSGSITTTDTAFGRISVAFYGGEGNFMVRTLGTRQFPINYINEDNDNNLVIGDLVGIADFTLRPSITNADRIRLKGVVNKFIRTVLSDPNSFTYSEESLDFVLPEDGGHQIEFSIGNNKRPVTLNIEATALDNIKFTKKIHRDVTYKCRYEIFNETTGEKRGQSNCTLGMSVDSDGRGSCSSRSLFYLANGDSLLYIPLIEIKDPRLNEDGTLTFKFEFSRIYALNPLNPSISPEEIRSDKTVINVSEKEVVTKPGETTEIRIAPDPDSQLPFAAAEIVKIKNELKVTRE